MKMKIYKEVEVDEAEVNDVIVRGFYQEARKNFYRFGNDHIDFTDYKKWQLDTYYEMKKLLPET